MYIDSHCHLNFPELHSQLPDILQAMQAAQVHQAVVICTTMEEFGAVQGLAAQHPHLWATVGVHPDNEGVHEPSLDELVAGAAQAKVIAIGETGLDYYQMDEQGWPYGGGSGLAARAFSHPHPSCAPGAITAGDPHPGGF